MLDKSNKTKLNPLLSRMKVSQTAILRDELKAEAKHIGACCARLRIARGIKQDVAAVRAGLSRNTAYRLENGDPGVAIGQFLRYLDAIAPGMTMNELLAQTDPSLVVLGLKEKTRRVRDLSSKEVAELDF
jgi:transcriptional regulator with XRE-family HTH domain